MSGAELTEFQLRIPHDLSKDGVLAALSAFSGLPHNTRLIFDLSATHDGITHRLAVSSHAADSVTGALRAAVPSLRLDTIESPAPAPARRVVWQLSHATAAIRVDDLAAVSARLLASLFPLGVNESLRLMWKARPARPPRFPVPSSDSRRDIHLSTLRAKLALPGLSVYGELSVTAGSKGRTAQLMQRTAAVLRSLATPHGRLVLDSPFSGQLWWLLAQRGRYMSVAELAAVIGWAIDGPDLPGLELGASRRLVPSHALAVHGRVLGTSDFAGVTRPVAITPSASTRGLYLLGPTGTGKTSLIKNLVRDDLAAGRGLAVVETNGDLVQDLLDLIPPERAADVVLIDPTDPAYAVGFNPFAGSSDPSLVADQLGELFGRLWKAYWGPRTAQLAHMGLLTLARRPGSTLLDLPRLFHDRDVRGRYLANLDDPVGLEPDWQWFERLSQREKSNVTAPLLNKVRQFTSRPSIRAIMGQATPQTTMRRIMAERKILLCYLPKGLIGSETATLLGCLVLTSVWQAATERAGLPIAQRHPFALYVDEVQDFASAPIPWDEMFAQGRKYGLALTVAHQNLDQLPRELREVILANARSKAVFALSATDAHVMERLFAPALTARDLQALDAYAVAALVALDSGATARPVTLSTPPPPPSAGSAEQVRRDSQQHYARLRSDVESNLRAHIRRAHPPAAPVGRRRRDQP